MLTTPVSGELRTLRADLGRAINPALDRLRRPALAALGFFVGASNITPTPLGRSILSQRRPRPRDCPFPFSDPIHTTSTVTHHGRCSYEELTFYGQEAAQSLQRHPAVGSALLQLAQTAEHLIETVDDAADDLHDSTEEALGRLSLGRYVALKYMVSTCTDLVTARWHVSAFRQLAASVSK